MKYFFCELQSNISKKKKKTSYFALLLVDIKVKLNIHHIQYLLDPLKPVNNRGCIKVTTKVEYITFPFASLFPSWNGFKVPANR